MRTLKKPQERREELIFCARELLEKNGIQSTSVSSIVKKVGVAQGLFYYYFSSKRDIIDAVVNQILDEIDTHAHKIICDTNRSFYTKLLDFVDLYFLIIDRFQPSLITDLYVPVNNKLREEIFSGARLINEKYGELLIDEGIRDHVVSLKYPYEMLFMTMHGLTAILHDRFVSKELLLTLLEQSLCLPAGSITQ